MERRTFGVRRAAWLVVFLLPGMCGCGSDELNSPTAKKLKALGNFYLEQAAAQQGKGPANEASFKKHLIEHPDFVLKQYDIDPKAIDATFVSERDNEPFVVLYGVAITEISGTKAPLIAHEKTGKNGKRLVGLANGKADLVDEAGLQALLTPKD